MYKLKLLLLPVALLLAFMAFACAPPDDDDRSSAPSKPTINNAIYDFTTALLTVQGTNLSPTEAQIQTIVVDGVALDSYTADEDATGPDSSGLEQGKYRIKSDGTALWLRLTDQHKATLEAKVDSNGLKKGLLTSSGAWAGLNTAKDLTVRNIPDKQSPKQTEQTEDKQSKTETKDQSPKLPEAEQAEEESLKQPKDKQVEEESPKAAITGATYNVNTSVLVITGIHLGSATQAQIQTIVVDGLALNSYIADGTATGPDSRSLTKGKYRMKSDGTALWLYLTDDDKTTLEAKPGMNTNGLKDGLLTSTGTWAGLNTAKALAVSGNPEAAITSATYNAITGVLVINGTNLPTAVTGWDFSKLRLVSGDGKKKYTLPDHNPFSATGSAASVTSLTITLTGNEKAKANAILVKDGDSDNAGAYNLEAAAGFAGGSAEDTSNPITVSGYASQLTGVHYYSSSGKLIIRGSRLPRAFTDWDFSKLTIVSGDGSKRYPLPQHAIGENTATGSAANTIGLIIILSGSVKAEVEKILVQTGGNDDAGNYNLEAAAGFVTGKPEDPTTSITKF